MATSLDRFSVRAKRTLTLSAGEAERAGLAKCSFSAESQLREFDQEIESILQSMFEFAERIDRLPRKLASDAGIDPSRPGTRGAGGASADQEAESVQNDASTAREESHAGDGFRRLIGKGT